MFSRFKILFAACLIHCGPPDINITKLTPDVTVAPGEFDFGEVIPSFSSDKTVQLVNSGRTTLSVSAIALSEESDVFRLTVEPPQDGSEWTLEPGASLPISLAFAPADLVSYEASVVISSNDDDDPEF